MFAYVYTSVLRNNYLVVRVRLNRSPMPHNSPDHSPTPGGPFPWDCEWMGCIGDRKLTL